MLAKSVLLKLQHTNESTGNTANTDCDSVGWEWGLRAFLLNKPSRDYLLPILESQFE